MEINEIEQNILKYWNENKIFEASLEKTKDCKPYIFYDGPPFATGTPHYGHLLGSVVKDIFGRFWPSESLPISLGCREKIIYCQPIFRRRRPR